MKNILIGAVLAVLASVSSASAADAAAILEKLGIEGHGEMVSQKPGGEAEAMLFRISSTRLRVEFPPYVGITDFRAKKTLLIYPRKKVYAEIPLTGDSTLEIYQNPCQESAELLEIGARCHNAGMQTVNGRKVEKWTVTLPEMGNEPFMTLYLDARYRFVVRKESEDGVEEISYFKESEQPAALFELPDGFRKVELESLATNQ